MTKQSPPESVSDTPAIDLSPLAPPIELRAHGVLIAVYLAMLAAAIIPALSHLPVPYSLTLAFWAPPILFFVFAAYNGNESDKIQEKYVAALLAYARLPRNPANYDLAKRAFLARQRKSNLARDISFATIAALWFTQSQIYWDHRSFNFETFHVGLSSIGNAILYLLVLIGALFAGVVPSLLLEPPRWTFQELTKATSVSRLELRESDKNDLQLVGVAVGLQSVHRRVDTYTLESTFLSALSFSAFMAIVYSERGPLEGIDWLSKVDWRTCADSLSVACVSGLSLSVISDHTMFIIAAFLLACSVFFLSVLLTRLRFNDAFRYAEEIVRMAEALNEKEDSQANGPFQHELTQEISRLLDRARDGVDDLGPMVSFMKFFRELGIVAFMGAIATCGMYFHWMVAAVILVLFTSALCFGFVDKLRRKSTFLPRLENTILHAIQRK